MSQSTYIVSDIHLGAVPAATERAFVAFLEHVRTDARALFIVGDLFDFWFEYGPVIPGRHFRALAALAAVADSGIPVTMVGGNHDAWGGRFLVEQVGIQFAPDGLRTTIEGKPAWVIHGDGVGSGDFKYRALKAVIRSRAATTAFRVLHPQIGMRIARAVSSTEGKSESPERVAGRARYIEDWARRQIESDPTLTWVVCGHAHHPTIAEVRPGRYYLNAGDWLRQFTYITISEDCEPQLKTW